MKKFGVVLLLWLFGAGGVVAAGDPTRPPAAWMNQTEQGTVDSGVLHLQSVLIPQRGRPVAVISGQTVVLGGRIAEARLIRLNEREAVLQGPDGVTRLYLTPGVEKRMIVAPGNKAGQSAQGKESR